jgi:hypothetical protein
LQKEEDTDPLQQITKAIDQIKPFFENVDKREVFQASNGDFHFTESFWSAFKNYFNYTQSIYEFPKLLENIIKNGGHKDIDKFGVKLVTCTYHDYANSHGYKTIIFDGTADIDLDYQHEKFNLINFDPIRTYESLDIYINNAISASKGSLNDIEKLKAFCEDVISISEEHPDSKIYIPTFKDNESTLYSYLKHYIESGKVLLAHYGLTKGSNKFKECDIVAICGILHKNENHYISKARAIYGVSDDELMNDIDCAKFDKLRRFNNESIEAVKLLDMLVEYSQEIKRCNQRNNAENVKGKVFIFHNDKLLLNKITHKFPNCQVKGWHPENLIEEQIEDRANNPNQKLFKDYLNDCIEKEITTIYYDEIKKNIQISLPHVTDKAFSKLYNKMKSFVLSKGFREAKEGRRKKLEII